jgi:hypothetical protein
MNKKTFSIAATILTLAGATSAFAGELPSYQANGFPVSPVQLRVLGSAHVEQQVSAPATAISAHQARVLTPRKLKTATIATGAAR